jgi:hypothetical protein
MCQLTQHAYNVAFAYTYTVKVDYAVETHDIVLIEELGFE